MIEIVNPSHPDKVADRIAGAIVDYAYAHEKNPKIAVEVLIGHGKCTIITETSRVMSPVDADAIVKRITGDESIEVEIRQFPQDVHLAHNQKNAMRCGDNGIFKGVPTSSEEILLSEIARAIYAKFPSDGKYILDLESGRLIICQSNVGDREMELIEIVENITKGRISKQLSIIINPLGDWTGGTNVDTGATNRKLGSDMGRAVTGGGLHGKDISKADVAVNIFANIQANEVFDDEVSFFCAIGDREVRCSSGYTESYKYICKTALERIRLMGGFEKLAEWGILC